MTVHRKRIVAVLSLLVVLVAAIFGGTVLSSKPTRSGSLPETYESRAERKTASNDKKVSVASVEVQTPEGMEPVLENETLRLYINRTTTEVAVSDKRSGQLWRSNPADREKDRLATPEIKSILSSQLLLTYFVQNNQTKTYNSYSDSVQYKQFNIEKTDKSVTVTYQFGSPEKGIESIPLKIKKARYDEKLKNRLDDPNDKEELDSRFKFNEEAQVYERREVPKAAVKRLIALLEKAGYAEEDLAQDNQENGVESTGEGGGSAKFTVPLQYSLDGDSLITSVDTTKIEENKSNALQSIKLLGSFGATGLNDKGYMLAPDGSGALIYLNNGKLLSQPLIIPIYGDDDSITREEKAFTVETNRMPVFGMKRGDAAFFAVIEDGEALAKVNADISGRYHDYNTIGSEFTVRAKDIVNLNESEQLVKTPKEMYPGKLQIRYGFMDGDQATYSGMAAYYQNYLEQKIGLKKQQFQGDTPFYMELLGSMSKPDSFLGIPYDSQETLTDFAQANQILDELNGQNIRNIRVSYNGWFNGGLDHRIPTGVKLESALGTRKEWEALGARLAQNGGGLYPGVSLVKVHRKSGFNPARDAAQFLSRKITKIFDYNLATYRKDSYEFSHYNLSPNKLDGVVSDFLEDYKDYNPGAISLIDLGANIHSDFSAGETVDRQHSSKINAAEAERIHKEISDIMASGGNASVLPYTSHLVNVPLDSNRYQLADESVPFMEMVLHGYVEYAGKPFNYADDQDVRKLVLKSLETGANVYYKWMYKDPASIKPNVYKELYATYYKDWFDEASQAYREVNEVLKQVRGQRIVSHEKLKDNVYKTTYENSLEVIVNYNREPVVIDGVTIKAEHYHVKG
ncbi:DUF5696 domain-containing protein [Paenibacillus sp. MBLB4367]|uniref:DUF5696 domain-containing protein n=1 Tax=Paenibacillus sp. MBLB4367 TaxID=3384767 RepID=UPI0039080700